MDQVARDEAQELLKSAVKQHERAENAMVKTVPLA
jgi:hypothetical protein